MSCTRLCFLMSIRCAESQGATKPEPHVPSTGTLLAKKSLEFILCLTVLFVDYKTCTHHVQWFLNIAFTGTECDDQNGLVASSAFGNSTDSRLSSAADPSDLLRRAKALAAVREAQRQGHTVPNPPTSNVDEREKSKVKMGPFGPQGEATARGKTNEMIEKDKGDKQRVLLDRVSLLGREGGTRDDAGFG
jgi:hypothetical protein